MLCPFLQTRDVKSYDTHTIQWHGFFLAHLTILHLETLNNIHTATYSTLFSKENNLI